MIEAPKDEPEGEPSSREDHREGAFGKELTEDHLVVAQHWVEELRRLMPGN
ncbi:MAG: hypothetical protein HY657_17325 [Acidobacteria bacterium]|nr:hypothetical protein [Acidobacteriota bacterium]